MNTQRGVIALVIFGLLALGGILLVQNGLYGMTIFVLLPVFLAGMRSGASVLKVAVKPPAEGRSPRW